MAFIARVVEHPGRVLLTSAVDGDGNPIENTYDVTRAEGTVYTEGTPLNPASLLRKGFTQTFLIYLFTVCDYLKYINNWHFIIPL